MASVYVVDQGGIQDGNCSRIRNYSEYLFVSQAARGGKYTQHSNLYRISLMGLGFKRLVLPFGMLVR